MTHEDAVALEKKQFKEKIMAKLKLDKKNPPVSTKATDAKKESKPGSQESSEYVGKQAQSKRLNQEAYQAYYNTSGCNTYTGGNP